MGIALCEGCSVGGCCEGEQRVWHSPLRGAARERVACAWPFAMCSACAWRVRLRVP